MSSDRFKALNSALADAMDLYDVKAIIAIASDLEEYGSDEAVAIACRARGWAAYCHGHFHEALSLYQQTLQQFERLDDADRAASIAIDIGSAYLGMGEFSMALEFFHRGLGQKEQLGNRDGVASATGNIGLLYLQIGDYPRALDHFYRALALHTELGSNAGVANVTAALGHAFDAIGNTSEALAYYQHALSLYGELGDASGTATVTNNIGVLHFKANEFADALAFFRKALDMNTAIGDHGAIISNMANIARVYAIMGAIDKAEDMLAVLDDMHFDNPGSHIQREMSRATVQAHYNQYDSAAQTLSTVLLFAHEHAMSAIEAELHKQLRDLALHCNDLQAYVQHNDAFTRITEELNGRDTTTRLALQEAERRVAAERQEHQRHLAVLHSTLPRHIADRVARGEAVSDHYDLASVIFLDIVGFTRISDRIPPGHVVHLLGQIFSALDTVCKKHDVTKIKTIGDSYMAVAFPSSEQRVASSEQRAAECAIDMLAVLNALEITMPPDLGDTSWTKDVGDIRVRIGIHCGPVTAGVIGTERLQYDVWGDTVNVASRMESTGESGRIHVSDAFAQHLTADALTLVPRGMVEVKGKGAMTTYWLESARQ